jgi:hypothetical protein
MTPETAASIESIILLVGGGLCALLAIGALVAVIMMLVRGKKS